MIKHNEYAPTTSNQITKSYYFTLLDQINRGSCSKKVRQVVRRNGNHEYITYHLTSTI